MKAYLRVGTAFKGVAHGSLFPWLVKSYILSPICGAMGGLVSPISAHAHFCKSRESVNFFSGVGEVVDVDPLLASPIVIEGPPFVQVKLS